MYTIFNKFNCIINILTKITLKKLTRYPIFFRIDTNSVHPPVYGRGTVSRFMFKNSLTLNNRFFRHNIEQAFFFVLFVPAVKKLSPYIKINIVPYPRAKIKALLTQWRFGVVVQHHALDAESSGSNPHSGLTKEM